MFVLMLDICKSNGIRDFVQNLIKTLVIETLQGGMIGKSTVVMRSVDMFRILFIGNVNM